MRSAAAMASVAPSTSERLTRRAVSSTLTWSAATACSNADWSRLNSGAVLSGALVARWWWRYSSRAASWSSGKPSKPSAWLKRTTVDEDVFARRASSSAVWKATSSRWSTTYWATSFWERENSSKRAEMYVESVWWPRAAGGMVAVLGMARRPFDGGALTSSRNATPPDATRRARPRPTPRARRRTRVLRGDVPRRRRAALWNSHRLR